jgi:antitoxin VapB
LLNTPHRHVSLFRNGANQALRIPKEFELPGTSAWVYRDGPRLVIEPVASQAASLALAMQGWADLDGDLDASSAFADIDRDLLALDDVVL